MSDLDHRFRSLDELEPTELRDDIEQRAGFEEPEPAAEPLGRRLVAAGVAIALALAASVFTWSRLRETPGPTPVPSAWESYPAGLTELAPPPVIRTGAVEVWTGDSLVIWGGNDQQDEGPDSNDGYAFNVTMGNWSAVPPADLAKRSGAVGVWTGQEVVVWGGVDGYGSSANSFHDGAAYGPATKTWRPIATDPFDGGAALGAVWTGSNMVVVSRTGASTYDPVSDTWQKLADLPDVLESGDVTWTGTHVVVVGNSGTERDWAPVAWALDPLTDSWRSLESDGAVLPALEVMWDGARIVATGGQRDASFFDEATQTWQVLPNLPVNDCEGGGLGSAALNGLVASNYCQELVTLEPGSDRWHVVVGRGTAPSPFGYWYRAPIPAGDAFILWGGSRQTPSAWVYRPPSPASITRSDRARDVAAAFGALRSDYPYSVGSVPKEIVKQIRSLLSPEARARWEDPESGLRAFWDYYPGFEVQGVEDNADDTFDATISFAGYSGGEFKEVVTIGPGTDMDGVARDLLVLDARPG